MIRVLLHSATAAAAAAATAQKTTMLQGVKQNCSSIIKDINCK